MPSIMEVERDNSPITGGEVTDMAKPVHSGRAPEVDEICSKFLTALDFVWLP